MGNDISSSISPPPFNLKDCFINGEIDLFRYRAYKNRRRQQNLRFHRLQDLMDSPDQQQPNSKRILPKRARRSVKKHRLLVRGTDGQLKEYTTKDTLWYQLYCSRGDLCDRLLLKFRNRFRIPHHYYKELVEEISNDEMFNRWTGKDCTGEPSSCLSLLILGSFRYLARAFTFDDLEEATAISRENHRQFFQVFIKYGSTTFYEKHVTIPAKTACPSVFEELFKQAGFNGCIGSGDATHVGMLSCASWATIQHKGHKLHIPSRSYNITVSHSRQILYSTSGHPSTWNDKSIVLFDTLIRGVHDGDIHSDYEFELLEYDNNGNIVKVIYKGVWFIVDNGYLSWSCTVPPEKDPVSYKYIRFSEWLESIRKDVECTFGILKGRFLILRYGLRLESIELCDQIWKTCCALHNSLLFIDGLHEGWESGEKSKWQKELSDRNNTLPKLNFAEQRLNSQPVAEHAYLDNNGEGLSQDLFKQFEVDNKRIVQKMPLSLFMDRLVENFDIRFKNNDITWPKSIPK